MIAPTPWVNMVYRVLPVEISSRSSITWKNMPKPHTQITHM